MNTADDLKKHFGKYKIPSMLQELAKYFDKYPQFFAGSFEVSADKFGSVKAWFRENKNHNKVLGFGIDGVGSVYGLWLCNNDNPEDAPVVYLGSEGEGSGVIASTLVEFLSILATNRDWEPFDKAFTDPEESNEEENKKFRMWLEGKFQIKPAKNPLQIVKKSRKSFPDFMKWAGK